MSDYRHKTHRHRKTRTVSGNAIPFEELNQGDAWLCLTKGLFSAAEVLDYVLNYTGPAQVYISTWSIGLSESVWLGSLLQSGGITELYVFIDRSWPTRHPEFCKTLCQAVGAENIRVLRVHAKIVVVRNADWGVVIRGSLNFNPNPRLEQFDMEENPALADWVIAQVFAGPTEELPDILHPDTAKAATYFRDLFEDVHADPTGGGDSWDSDEETPVPDEFILKETKPL